MMTKYEIKKKIYMENLMSATHLLRNILIYGENPRTITVTPKFYNFLKNYK